MLTVAIAAENDDYDAEIYREILALSLGRPITRHPTQRTFSGCRSVRDLSPAYLRDADRKGVKHALFAIDNDGGAKKHPEHDPAHDGVAEAADEKAGCRRCWLEQNLPAWWTESGRKRCIVVPVQTIETWLLCIRGHTFSAPSPEQRSYRDALKKDFFGTPLPPAAKRLELALAEIRKPSALAVLRQRRSFQHFEMQLAGWP